MFKSVISLALFSAAAFAQNVAIRLPQQGASVTAGETITVQIDRPNTLSSSQEVAIVIGFHSCSNGVCVSPTQDMGTILYNGPFNPQNYDYSLPPYENFTVQVPTSTATGTATFTVAHFTLLGADLYPFMETLNQTVTVA